MGSQPGGSAETPLSDWIAVLAMVVGASAMAVAIILAIPWLGIAGGALLVAGAIYAFATGIMNRTEDYDMGREDTA
ncbi:MAG: hypothetical protein ACJ74O_16715 [Frankiaceae bacterium]